jgi:hypothetical protein
MKNDPKPPPFGSDFTDNYRLRVNYTVKMKNIRFTLSVIFTLLTLIGCASRHAPATVSGTNSIVGSWENILISHLNFFSKSIQERNRNYLTLEFYQDGRFSGVSDDDPFNGSYETKGNQLIWRTPEVDKMTFEVSGDNLKIIDSEGFTILLTRKK